MTAKITPTTMEDVEDAFRYMAFKIRYNKTYGDVKSNNKRFLDALDASMEPIGDEAAMVAWYNEQHPQAPYVG